jgi:Tol biopolymer transport system component
LGLIWRENAAGPAWSPDGTQIAFFGEAPTHNTGIWLMGARAQNPRQLFPVDNASASDQDVKDHIKNIVWSPDGSKLAFEVDTPLDDPVIRVINADLGSMIAGFSGRQPAWSPDGQHLVINHCFGPNCGLWRLDFLGGSPIQLTDNPSDSYPTWSRLNYLAFSRRLSNGTRQIFQRRLPGISDFINEEWLAEYPPEQLTFLNGTSTTPVFGPYGRRIFFRSDAIGGSDNWDILAIELASNGSGPGTLLNSPIRQGVGPSDDAGLARPAIH